LSELQISGAGNGAVPVSLLYFIELKTAICSFFSKKHNT
jgi:hypothetical protein